MIGRGWRGVAAASIGLAAIATLAGADRPSGPTGKTRSSVVARRGMAATSHPLASLAAVRAMQGGGNAIDAAIAANAVLGVVEPMSCGPGGDLYAIVWDAKGRRLVGLNASGRSPGSASIEAYRSRGLASIPTDGPLSWSVPGAVDGWDQLRARFGSKGWADLLGPAIELAQGGFAVSEIGAGQWADAAPALAAVPTSAACYLPGGRAPAAGDLFRNPGLARTLRSIAEGGADAFYRGPIAEAIAAYSRSAGGLLDRSDLAEHESTWVDPVSTRYRGFEAWELPPPGQGAAALEMLNLLEPYDLRAMGRGSAAALHLMIEAKKLAYEDRARYYADPDFARVPTATLISKAYAAERGRRIDRNHANPRPTWGEPKGADTICLSVVDAEGNAVSLIQSVYFEFGSKHVPGDLGFALQNRGALFALDAAHPNRLEPRKRPFHTIIPGFVTLDGEPWLAFGLMGGDMQAQGHAQVLVDLIDHGVDVQEAADAPRFFHFGSSRPTGPVAVDGGSVAIESGIGPEVRAALGAMGHRIAPPPDPWAYGGFQAIRIDRARGVLVGGSDPRKDGCALGY